MTKITKAELKCENERLKKYIATFQGSVRKHLMQMKLDLDDTNYGDVKRHVNAILGALPSDPSE